MKNNLKISIITPSFNSVKTIERTMLSVLNQNYKNIEYIVIDGGSTDGTVDIIKKYQDRLSYWISESDDGISDAFNKGIKISNGDVVGIVNSDDWYEDNILSYVYEIFANKDTDCLVGGLRYWGSDGLNFVVMPDKKYYKKIKFKMPNLNHPTCFLRKEVYSSIGSFDISYKYAMDYDLFLRAYNGGAKFFVSDLIISNMSLDGVSDKYAVKTYFEEFRISEKKLLSSLHISFSILKYYIRRFILFLGLNSFLNKIRHIKYKN